MMSGNLRRPSHKYLLTHHDVFTAPADLAGATYHAIGAKARRKIRLVAAYYDWFYSEMWGGEPDDKRRRAYISLVLGKYLVLSSLAASEHTSLGTTTYELLEQGPDTEPEFIDMYYRSSFLPEDERNEMREEYEHNPEDYEYHNPIPRAARVDTVRTK